MGNLEYLKNIKKAEKDYFKLKNIGFDGIVKDPDCDNYRQAKALEIIAEELIGINDKLNSFINDGKVINVDTHEV